MGIVMGGVVQWRNWWRRSASSVLGAALACALSGCPIGADLEDPMRFRERYYPPAGGSGGGGTVDPGVDPGCDYVTALQDSCAKSGCHSTRTEAGSLVLFPDEGLIDRLYDVPSTHSQIDCGSGGVFEVCDWPSEPASCFPFADALLVDSQSVEDSWLLKKINGTSGGCGEAMPPSGYAITDGARACLEQFVRAVAAR